MIQNDFENGVKVEFFLDGKPFALRHTRLIPIIGDEVRFRGVAYSVVYRIWIYDEDRPRVALSIEKVEDPPAAESEGE